MPYRNNWVWMGPLQRWQSLLTFSMQCLILFPLRGNTKTVDSFCKHNPHTKPILLWSLTRIKYVNKILIQLKSFCLYLAAISIDIYQLKIHTTTDTVFKEKPCSFYIFSIIAYMYNMNVASFTMQILNPHVNAYGN